MYIYILYIYMDNIKISRTKDRDIKISRTEILGRPFRTFRTLQEIQGKHWFD